jgi:hypothetical protein
MIRDIATKTGDGPLDPLFQRHDLGQREVEPFDEWVQRHVAS